jgi:hypothetical protein
MLIGQYPDGQLPLGSVYRASSGAAVTEQNPHWVGKNLAPQYLRNRWLFHECEQSAALGAQPDTAPNFLGKYLAPTFRQIPWSQEANTPISVIIETNSHWIGKYQAPLYKSMPFPHGSEQSAPLGPQPDTAPNFLGKYVAPQFKQIPWSTAMDISVAGIIETNVHWIGTYRAPIYQKALFQDTCDQSAALGPQPDTAPNFTGKYSLSSYTRMHYLSDAQDTSGVIPPPPPAPAPQGGDDVPSDVWRKHIARVKAAEQAKRDRWASAQEREEALGNELQDHLRALRGDAPIERIREVAEQFADDYGEIDGALTLPPLVSFTQIAIPAHEMQRMIDTLALMQHYIARYNAQISHYRRLIAEDEEIISLLLDE